MQQPPDYDATGIFEATTVTVAAETAGKILTFNIEEGDSVEAGSEVALIDTVLLSLQAAKYSTNSAPPRTRAPTSPPRPRPCARK